MSRLLRTSLFALGLSVCAAAPSDAEARRLGGALRAMRALPHVAQAARSYGQQSDGTHVLTVSELSACLTSQRTLQSDNLGLTHKESQLTALRDEVEALGNRLDRLENAGSYEAYNDLVPRYNSTLGAFKLQLQHLDGEFDAFNAQVERFNSRCAGRSYYTSDLVAAGGR